MMRRVLITFILLLLLLMVAMKISHAGAGSFTIIGGNTFSTNKVNAVQIYNGATGTNYSSYGYPSIGKYGASSNISEIITQLPTLIDTLRIVGSTHQIDSANIMYTTHAAGTAGDSVFAAMYEIIRTFVIGTGASADTCGVTWDSAYMVGDGSCSGTAAAWGTAGCNNTTTDRKSTRETVTGHADSVLFTAGVADNDDTTYFWISGATIADTSNFKGLIMIPVAYGGDDGVQSLWTLHNLATAYPKLTVWYSDKVVAGGTSKRRRIVLGRPQ
jgi:hypothetical protein